MNVLYIIGNGFDLWHGLPTKYADFYKFAESTLSDLEDFFEQYGVESPWSDFENDLGKYDWEQIYMLHEEPKVSSEHFRFRDVYIHEDAVNDSSVNLVSEITDAFEEWVESIDISPVKAKMSFIPGSKFLSFNYTSTLQTVYKIEHQHIQHIHGSVKDRERLVFGHCNRTQLPEFDDEGYSLYGVSHDAIKAARQPLIHFEKPVASIIDRFSSWFGELSEVESICIIGHSLNQVDLPYFKKILDINPSANWIVSGRSDASCEKHKETLINIGIPAEKIRICSFDGIDEALERKQFC